MFQEAGPLIAVPHAEWKCDKPDRWFCRRRLLSPHWSSHRRAGSPGLSYRGKKAIPLFRNRLNIGADGPATLQDFAQERDLTGQADFFDEAVGPQRRHQIFLAHQMAWIAHQ